MSAVVNPTTSNERCWKLGEAVQHAPCLGLNVVAVHKNNMNLRCFSGLRIAGKAATHPEETSARVPTRRTSSCVQQRVAAAFEKYGKLSTALQRV
jgi:hypothetical protein